MFPILAKLLRLPRSERADLVAAQGALLAAWATVATRRRGQLVSAAAEPAATAPAVPDERSLTEARMLATAVSRAAAHGVFRPRCLVRAVALKRLLDARGLAGSRVQVGVRTHLGAFAAHAWVEYGAEVLGDRPEHVNTFAPLHELAVLEQR